MNGSPKFTRVLLKLSGESLGGPGGSGFDPQTLGAISSRLAEIHAMGVSVGIVVGGGNFFRGLASGLPGCDRVDADQIGMLATVMNGLALKAALSVQGVTASVMSSFAVGDLIAGYSRQQALSELDQGLIVVFTGGTGNPLFTTDSAAALRAVEMNAEVLIKATRVDGVYESDPEKNPDAKRYSSLTYKEVIDRGLAVMDTTAFVLCRDSKLPIRVLDLNRADSLRNAVMGMDEGTLIS